MSRLVKWLQVIVLVALFGTGFHGLLEVGGGQVATAHEGVYAGKVKMGLGILGLDAYGAAEIDDGGDIFPFLSEYSGARVVWFGLIRV